MSAIMAYPNLQSAPSTYLQPRRTGNSVRDLVHDPKTQALAFCAAQIPLALLVQSSSVLATLHAYALLAIGLATAASKSSLQRTAYVLAYIASFQVIWRMSN